METRSATVSASQISRLPSERRWKHCAVLLPTDTYIFTDNETGSNNGNDSANGGNDNGNGNASGNNLQGLGNFNLPDFNLIKIEDSKDREDSSAERSAETYN